MKSLDFWFGSVSVSELVFAQYGTADADADADADGDADADTERP
jgi:hypothetical protein